MSDANVFGKIPYNEEKLFILTERREKGFSVIINV